MSNIIAGTHILSPDEKAWNLTEVNLAAPDSRGLHRYQIITVIRNDTPVDCKIDLGLARNFTANEFRIPALGLHSVAELREIADHLRDNKARQPDNGVIDLISLYAEYVEQRRK